MIMHFFDVLPKNKRINRRFPDQIMRKNEYIAKTEKAAFIL